MAERISFATSATTTATLSTTTTKKASLWPTLLRWIPTSTDQIIAAEKRLLSIVNHDELGTFPDNYQRFEPKRYFD